MLAGRLQKAVSCFVMPPATLSEAVAPHIEIEDGSGKGGNRGFTCTHCSNSYQGSLTRQLAHLLGRKNKGIARCQDITPEDRAALQTLCDSIESPAEGARGSSSGSFFPREHAGACERNWSTYDFIHRKKRNSLKPDRANDLVYVFTNSRLIQRFKEPEKFAEWVQEIASDDEKEEDEEFEEESED